MLRVVRSRQGVLRDVATELAGTRGRVPRRHGPGRGGGAARPSNPSHRASRRRRATPRSTFEFRQVEGELLIEARCGSRTSEVRCPLPA